MTLTLSLYNQHPTAAISVPVIQEAVQRAIPLVLGQHLKEAEAPLAQLEEIEATIVTDEAIAQVHADFLDDPTPTDVITFHHGEIIISADTAAREGPAHGLSLNEELTLYLIHGLMHLAGWDDHEELEAAEMKRRQEEVLAAVRN